MQKAKTLAISAGMTALLVGFLGIMQDSVGSGQASSPTFNATASLTESVVSLTPLVALVLAAALVLASLGVLN
jgi:hypothetical protein